VKNSDHLGAALAHCVASGFAALMRAIARVHGVFLHFRRWPPVARTPGYPSCLIDYRRVFRLTAGQCQREKCLKAKYATAQRAATKTRSRGHVIHQASSEIPGSDFGTVAAYRDGMRRARYPGLRCEVHNYRFRPLPAIARLPGYPSR
jgi:hypothetical protein